MTKGAKIKIVIVSALLVSCIAGLTVYAGQDHTTDKDTTVVAKTKAIKEKVIVEESIEAAEAKTEELEPIKPVRVIPIVEVVDNDNKSEQSEQASAGLSAEEQVGSFNRTAVLGNDSDGNEDYEQVSGEDNGVSEIPEIEEPVYEEPVVEEPVYEEPEYVEPVEEEPTYEEPVAEEPPQEETGMEYLGCFTVSAYCNCAICTGQWAGGPCADGSYPVEGYTCAMGGVDFGTVLYIDGVGYRTVCDRGTDYGWVDLYMEDHGACLNWGLQYLDVYIVR